MINSFSFYGFQENFLSLSLSLSLSLILLPIYTCLQGYHRDLLEHSAPLPPPGAISIAGPPPPFIGETPNKTSEGNLNTPLRKIPAKRGRERRSNSKRHRKVAAGSRDVSSG